MNLPLSKQDRPHGRPQPVSRDRRISRAMLGGLVGVGLLGLVTLLAGVLANRFPSDFTRGFRLGLGVTFPLSVLAMVWAGYRQMDEYGRSLHARAGGAGFMAAMLASAIGSVVEAQGYGRLPLWGVYVLGMLTYSLATGVLSLRGSRAGR